jgi:hypothetical protein
MDENCRDSQHAKRLLSFVTDATGKVVSVHADIHGVEFLIDELENLRSQLLVNDCPHTHLFSPECGGDELTMTKLNDQPAETNVVCHVKIYGWNEEWSRRHGLKH